MRITVNLDIDEDTMEYFSTNSVERIINTSVRLVDLMDEEEASINRDDWQFAKPIVTGLWEAVSNAIYAHRNKHLLKNYIIPDWNIRVRHWNVD